MNYLFEGFALDTERRELRRGANLIPIEPQVFDLLEYLIRNRARVVSKEDVFAAVWHGRIVSDSALTSRINSARSAIGDKGDDQCLIKTLRGKGFRFVGVVQERRSAEMPRSATAVELANLPLPLPDRPSIAVLPFMNMSGDPEQQYFVDGIAEDLITELSRFPRCLSSPGTPHSSTKAEASVSRMLLAISVFATWPRAASARPVSGFELQPSSWMQRAETISGPNISTVISKMYSRCRTRSFSRSSPC